MRYVIATALGATVALLVLLMVDTFFGIANDPVLGRGYMAYRIWIILASFLLVMAVVLSLWPRRDA